MIVTLLQSLPSTHRHVAVAAKDAFTGIFRMLEEFMTSTKLHGVCQGFTCTRVGHTPPTSTLAETLKHSFWKLQNIPTLTPTSLDVRLGGVKKILSKVHSPLATLGTTVECS